MSLTCRSPTHSPEHLLDRRYRYLVSLVTCCLALACARAAEAVRSGGGSRGRSACRCTRGCTLAGGRWDCSWRACTQPSASSWRTAAAGLASLRRLRTCPALALAHRALQRLPPLRLCSSREGESILVTWVASACATFLCPVVANSGRPARPLCHGPDCSDEISSPYHVVRLSRTSERTCRCLSRRSGRR